MSNDSRYSAFYPSNVSSWSWWGFYWLFWPSHKTAYFLKACSFKTVWGSLLLPSAGYSQCWDSPFRVQGYFRTNRKKEKQNGRRNSTQPITTLKILFDQNLGHYIYPMRYQFNVVFCPFERTCVLHLFRTGLVWTRNPYPLKIVWLMAQVSLLLMLFLQNKVCEWH